MKQSLAIFLALCVPVGAAVITSNGTGGGNWNTPSTWLGGVVPGNGDNTVLANGDTVTVPVSVAVTIGSSPADNTGTPAIACSSATGTGVLNVNGSLTFRGPVTQCNSTWTLGPGASLIHDSSQAPTPSATNYTWKVGMANLQVGSKFVASGTAASRAILTIATGSGNAGGVVGTTTTTTDSGQVQLTYTDVDHWGVSTGYFVRAYPNSAGFDFHLDHCRISNSGSISIAKIASSTTERILGTSITAPIVPSNSRYIEIGYQSLLIATPTGADLRIQDSYIEGMVALTVNSSFVGGDAGWKYLNTVFAGGTSSLQAPLLFSNAPSFAVGNFDLVFTYNRITSSSDNGQLPAGTISRFLNYRNWSNNPHYSNFPSSTVTGHPVTAIVQGSISESMYDVSAGGDMFMSSTSVSPTTYSITGSIALPTPGGQAIGTFTNHSTTTACNGTTVLCPVYTVDRNTIVGDSFGTYGASASGVSGESNSGFAGIYASVRNNILWESSPNHGWMMKWSNQVTPVSGAFPSADYNHYWNIMGNRYYCADGVNDPTTPACNSSAYNPPGAHDQNLDPMFMERTRNFLSWGKHLDPSLTTWAAIIAKFAKVADDDYDPRFNILDLYNWIRAGFRPQNPAIWSSASDGSYAGAVTPNSSFGRGGVN